MPRSPLLDKLAARLILPGRDSYDQERSGFQTGVPLKPAMIVAARTSADVSAAVEYASANGLGVTVQATGHGLVVPVSDGVLISTRHMNTVSVDGSARAARIEAGVRMSQIVEAAAPFGLAPVGGSAPAVGAVSFTLGGGVSIIGRHYGFAADHVRSIDVVTADGHLRRVTAENEPDLFWALRGGRTNFGIATAIEIGLVPVTHVYGGGLFFATELIPSVLRTYLGWTRELPDEMSSSIAMIPFPNLPMVPEPLRGRHVAYVRIVYTGDTASGERLVAPLRAVGPRLIDAVTDLPYTSSGTIYNEPTEPLAFYQSNAMLSEITEAMVEPALGLDVVEIRHLGGATQRPPAVDSAVGHRATQYILRIITRLANRDVNAIRSAHARVHAALAPWTLGSCLNFMSTDTPPDQMRRFYDADDYERLVRLKAIYDPTNTFRYTNTLRA